MAYIEEDVDLVRAREGALGAEMLACLQHLVILELVRVRFCGSLPLTAPRKSRGRGEREKRLISQAAGYFSSYS